MTPPAPRNIPEPFRRLFAEPFPFVDCRETREFISAQVRPDHAFHQRLVTVRRLGLSPGDFIFDNGYDQLPDIVLYHLQDVPMYHSLSFSKAGGVFPPSLRYRQLSGVTGFSLPRPINPRPLGGGYFAYLNRPKTSEVRYVTEPAMPFYTFPEYGHYLMESLPSLYFLRLKPDLKLILPPETKEIPNYLREMVAPFGLDEKVFLIPSELSVFKEFYLPSRLYMEASYLNSPAKEVYAHVARRYKSPTPAGRRIYLSRRGIRNRCLVNEAECEALLTARGFEIIRPEELTFARQVDLFASASEVIAAAGTAHHNVVFSARPERLRVLLMVPEGLLAAKNCYQIESSFGRRPTVVFGRYLDPEVATDFRLSFYAPWHLDLPELETAVDQWLEEG